MKCTLCEQTATPLFRETVLRTYPVQYFHCDSCNSVFTEKAHWLDEAYHEAISELDTGILVRNLKFRDELTPVLHHLLSPEEPAVDVSGGYGLFTRLMRDRGFHFYSTDPYCPNLFASHFGPPESLTCSVLTLFEVLEHLEDPLPFLNKELDRYQADTLLLSTQTFTGPPPDPGWWYYMFESGQHVRFYSPAALDYLAGKLKMTCHPLNASEGFLWLLTRKSLPRTVRKWVASKNSRAKIRASVLQERKGLSLTMQDHQQIKQHKRPAPNPS